MNRLAIAGFFLLTFAGGLGVGYLMRGGAESAPEQVAEKPDQPRESGEGQPANTTKAPREANPPGGESDPEPNRPQPGGDLARAIAGIDAGEIARGDGVITGKVTGPNGEPLEGVQVVCWPQVDAGRGWQAGDGPLPKPDIENSIRGQIRRQKRNAETRREVLTGADGSYRIEGLAEGKHSVYAYARGFIFDHADRDQRGGVKPGATVDFIATKSNITLSFKVLMPNGSAAESARIKITRVDEEARYSHNWRPSDLSVTLPSGRYTLRAEAGKFKEYSWESCEIVPEPGSVTAEITVQLKARNGLRGVVKVPEDWDDGGIWIYIAPYHGKRKPDQRTLRSSKITSSARDDEGFRFHFWDLKPGRYLLGAHHSWQFVVEATVDVGEGQTVKDLVFPTPKREEYLIVRVYGPDGKLSKNVGLNTRYRYENLRETNHGDFKLKNGSRQINHPRVPKGDDGKGAYTIAVWGNGFVEKVFDYTRVAETELELHLEAPALISVTLTGYEESNLDGEIYLDAVNLEVNNQRSHRARESDGEGTFHIEPMGPGSYSVRIYLRDDRRPLLLATHTLTAVSGENTLTVPLPRLNAVTVSAANAEPGTEVIIRSHEDPEAPDEPDRESFYLSATVGDNQVVTFKHVPVGYCRIRMQYRDSGGNVRNGMMHVRIIGRADLIFAPE